MSFFTRYIDELARRMYVDAKEDAAVRAGFMRETAGNGPRSAAQGQTGLGDHRDADEAYTGVIRNREGR